MMAATWQATLFLGAATLILGLIVSFHPTGSLNVIAVLLGIWFVIMGIFEIIGGLLLRRAFRDAEKTPV